MIAADEGSKGFGASPDPADSSPTVRASDRERDAVVQRVQEAFADGRLDDTEFDERMRAALTARTHADLDVLLSPSGGDHDRSFERIVSGRRVDGVIVMEIRLDDPRPVRLQRAGMQQSVKDAETWVRAESYRLERVRERLQPILASFEHL